jgi:branched-chain amino acid transport system permease protein
MVAVGGIGSVGGVAFAAVVMTVLPHWLQVIAEYKLLLYGALLFAVMRFSPRRPPGWSGRGARAVRGKNSVYFSV